MGNTLPQDQRQRAWCFIVGPHYHGCFHKFNMLIRVRAYSGFSRGLRKPRGLREGRGVWVLPPLHLSPYETNMVLCPACLVWFPSSLFLSLHLCSSLFFLFLLLSHCSSLLLCVALVWDVCPYTVWRGYP